MRARTSTDLSWPKGRPTALSWPKRRPAVIAAIAAVVTLACTSATAGAATGRPVSHGAGRAPDSCTTWQTVRSSAPGFTDPPQSLSEAALGSVSVLSGHDVWFAGLNDAGPETGPWVTHWNGHSVTTPQHVPLVPQAQSPYRNPVEPGSFDSSGDGGWIAVGGTSVASPSIAGV